MTKGRRAFSNFRSNYIPANKKGGSMEHIEVNFIRHGTTQSNLEGRLCGRTDSPLISDFISEMKEMVSKYPYPLVEHCYRSPAQRCRETLEIIYPCMKADMVEDLWEFDFGDMDGMLVQKVLELMDLKAYYTHDPCFSFPNGEMMGAFLQRTYHAMDLIVRDAQEKGFKTIAIITHSMLLDSLMSNCAQPTMTEEERFCPNGKGIGVRLAPVVWFYSRVLYFVRLLPEGAPRERFKDSPYYHGKKENIH